MTDGNVSKRGACYKVAHFNPGLRDQPRSISSVHKYHTWLETQYFPSPAHFLKEILQESIVLT